MMNKVINILMLTIGFLYQPILQAMEPVRLDDRYGDAFLDYQPYVIPGQEKDKTTRTKSNNQLNQPQKKEEKVDVAWLRKHLPLLLDRAIDDPTKDNVSAFLYTQRVAMDKGQRYQEVFTKVTNEDPLLNENNRIPYATMGSQSIRNANYLAQQQAVREMAEQGGMVMFVDSICRFCSMQIPIATSLKNLYGMETLIVTIDGKAPKGYVGQLLPDNGLFQKIGLKLTPSIVYVHRPRAYVGTADPNQYLIISQGFYAADELVKVLAFAGHDKKILSQKTSLDLDVWTRGVTSNEDLQNLKLDPNDPIAIKKMLQPLLLKQY